MFPSRIPVLPSFNSLPASPAKYFSSYFAAPPAPLPPARHPKGVWRLGILKGKSAKGFLSNPKGLADLHLSISTRKRFCPSGPAFVGRYGLELPRRILPCEYLSPRKIRQLIFFHLRISICLESTARYIRKQICPLMRAICGPVGSRLL